MKTKKSFSFYLLLVVVGFQSISALFGGFSLITSPNGATLEMPVTFLKDTPFTNFLIPGLVLFFLLGVFPIFILAGLYTLKNWSWPENFNIYKNRHWSWTFSLYLSIMLIIWIDLQIMWVGYGNFIQTLYALVGVLILVVTLLPSNMKYFEKQGK